MWRCCRCQSRRREQEAGLFLCADLALTTPTAVSAFVGLTRHHFLTRSSALVSRLLGKL